MRDFWRYRVCGRALESELCEGGFLTVIANCVNDQVFRLGHVGFLVAAGRVYFADEGFADSRHLVKCDAPDTVVPFAPTYGGDILFNVVVGVPGFGNDSARQRVVVEGDGGVGACLRVACEPVAGGVPVEPSRAAPRLVDGLHDVLFNAWGDGSCVGGVLVGEVAHGTFPAFSLGWSCYFVCLRILIVARCRRACLWFRVFSQRLLAWCARPALCACVGGRGCVFAV